MCPRHPMKDNWTIWIESSFKITRPCLPPSFFIYLFVFVFCVGGDSAAGFWSFLGLEGGSLSSESTGRRKKDPVSAGFFFHRLLQLILGPQGVVGWWWGGGGSAAEGVGLLKGDLCSTDWSRSTPASATKKGSLVLTSSFVGLRHWSFSCQCSELPSCPDDDETFCRRSEIAPGFRFAAWQKRLNWDMLDWSLAKRRFVLSHWLVFAQREMQLKLTDNVCHVKKKKIHKKLMH